MASEKTKLQGEITYLIEQLKDQQAKIPGSGAVDPNKEKLVKSLEYLQSLVKKAEQQVKESAKPAVKMTSLKQVVQRVMENIDDYTV